ncbi:hypothetical protein CQ046_03250 [Chryseobacterium sp. MYb7]|uniref:hypothetical protein n=1 Tax=Chryseobacterium sp. MYb7 TaxID=1827290 RepID=UPI000CFEBA6C|nr:hypothetical protein [Chryseobacterium sp. MYb7]PRB06199.1 hypothetical protein CQ046_03250 [Chryseobacterium sp. MYb7]
MSNQENFKNFISKLNDRNLQRKRESGFTSYVLYSALIFCLYKLYKNVFYYFQNLDSLDIYNSIFLICFTSNSMIACYYIIITFQSEKKTFSNLTTIKHNKLNMNFYGYLLMFIFFLIPILSTFLSIRFRTTQLDFEYFLILGILNLISISILTKILVNNPKKIKIVKSNNDTIPIEAITFFTSLGVIIYSFIISVKIELFEKFIFVKIVILTYVILFIIDRIINQNNNDDNTFNLENFEYEIYLKNFNDDQIREKLQENYIGYLIDDWIEFNIKKINTSSFNIANKITNIKSQLVTLSKEVDAKKYPIEFEGRKKQIIGNFQEELKIEVNSFSKLINDIKKIINDKRNLTDIENQQLIDLEENISKFTSKYKDYKI